MGPPSYMRSVHDRNVVILRILLLRVDGVFCLVQQYSKRQITYVLSGYTPDHRVTEARLMLSFKFKIFPNVQVYLQHRYVPLRSTLLAYDALKITGKD